MVLYAKISFILEVFTIINWLRGLFKVGNKASHEKIMTPVIIPRHEHPISRHAINHNALKVLYRLHEAGFSAYLVGGCVRDLLLNIKPKDFDIATNASPDEIRKLFKNCRLIGKRFRLAHIFFGREIIEVATFRTHHINGEDEHGKSHQGMIIRDNVYGHVIEEDVYRRDFRINALYYNIADFTVVDYVGGMQDIQNRILHMIGDSEKRFQEDPVRLLRAVRFAAKLNFTITPETEEPLKRLAHLLQKVAPARLFQEVIKIFKEGATLKTMELLQEYKLFAQLFPDTAWYFENKDSKNFLLHAFRNTDQRIREGKPVSPAFIFATLLWYPLQNQLKHLSDHPNNYLYEKALQHILKIQIARLAIPRLMQVNIREICLLQNRLTQIKGAKPYRILAHPRFRAGYDLLLLRGEHDESVKKLADWWTGFYYADMDGRREMVKAITPARPRKSRGRKRKRMKIATPRAP